MDLDKPENYKKIDRTDFLKNIQEFPLQCERAWEEIKKVVLPSYYLRVNKVVILGLGGSAIGGDLLKALVSEKIKVPFLVIRDYDLPAAVDKDSLVVGMSYSGNTEETLETFSQARRKKAKLIAITTGGKLAELARSLKIPFYQFDYQAEPRQSLGFLFTSLLGVLNKIALIDQKEEEFEEAILLLKALGSKIRPEIPLNANLAKKIALKLYNKIVITQGSGHLKPVAQRFKTQLNENSKQMAFWEELPEACHNFIVGLEFPKGLSEEVFILLLSSKFDHPRVRVRQKAISEILEKNKIPYEILAIAPAPSPLAEMLSFIFLLDYTSFYLAILNKVDPRPVSNINFLKKRLENLPWKK